MIRARTQERRRRQACGGWLLLHLSWYWISPWLHSTWSHHDEAAWVGLFLLPTLVLGGLAGLIACIKPEKWTCGIFALLSLAHLMIGFGFHPT